MMTIKRSSRWSQLRALAVVPVMALAMLAFANPSMKAAAAVSAAGDQDNKTKVYESVEQMPEFPGGIDALVRYLSANVVYPPQAAKDNIEGRVMVQFVIDKTGKVGDVQVARSVSEELDAEAVRVVKSLPDFIPGRQDGKPVAVWYTLPIVFKIQGDSDK